MGSCAEESNRLVSDPTSGQSHTDEIHLGVVCFPKRFPLVTLDS